MGKRKGKERNARKESCGPAFNGKAPGFFECRGIIMCSASTESCNRAARCWRLLLSALFCRTSALEFFW
ncbi:unnamed protein product [Gongylonema pulchrum]|uniref:Uncharacterized protein n=1 Tax=Gongylonema pulchrum TaxID=637853 RepID=A0A183DCK1_9BILA|nr:unnamed protein product [Gongylonema pulchrum]